MENTPNTTRVRTGVALAVAALVMSIAGVVAAQSGPSSDCSGGTVVSFGSQFFGLEDSGNRLLSTSPTSREFAMATPLAAGTYDINGVSYDGYEQRELISPQPQEQWFAEFLDASGAVLGTTGITGDLEDNTTEASWSGSLGQVTIAAEATTVRVKHAAPGSASVNSVRPVCIGASGGPAPTTTEAPVVAPDSSVKVDFTSTASESSRLSLVCGDLEESALGTELNLAMTNVPASGGCVVEYPANLDCIVAVEPPVAVGATAPGIQNIKIRPQGDANISVLINCADAQVAAPTVTTTTVAPAAPATTEAPKAEVASQVETAPAAQAQDGQPAFTG